MTLGAAQVLFASGCRLGVKLPLPPLAVHGAAVRQRQPS